MTNHDGRGGSAGATTGHGPRKTFGTVKPAAVKPVAAYRPLSPKAKIKPRIAPAPPQARSRQARHPFIVVLNFLFMAMFLGAAAVGAALYWGKLQFESEGPLTEARSVLIPPGSGLNTIASKLAETGIVDDALIFRLGVKAYGHESRMKAGEYLFEPGDSMQLVMEKIVSGRAILHAVTFPEGWTSNQIVARLRADETLIGDIDTVPAEGAMMPDTYKFSRGATRQQIIDQMRAANDEIVSELWAQRPDDLPVRTKEEFVTLASIVEKETGVAAERPKVAAVFINRLRRNMRLQSDPTVIYGLFGGEGKPSERPIYASDLKKETPYNTYVIPALPPGPIANPGRASLEAVIAPADIDSLYFVADGTGGHAFAKTLAEHNRNVARWRRIERNQNSAQADD